MHRLLLAIPILVIAAGLAASAQQTSTPTFRAATTLIDFTLVAVDRKGNAVTDLRADEVSVLEDNQPRAVAFFRYEGAREGRVADTAAAGRPLLPGFLTNRPDLAPSAPQNVIAVVVDAVNGTPHSYMEISKRLSQYLKRLPSNTRVTLYVLGEQTLAVHDFTDDPQELLAQIALGKLDVVARKLQTADAVASPQASPEQRSAIGLMAQSEGRIIGEVNRQLQIDRVNRTLSGLEALANHLAGVRGRKSLIWLSNGMPLKVGLPVVDDYEPQITSAAQHIASHDIAIYPTDAKGLLPPALYGTGLGIDDQGKGTSKGQSPTANTMSVTRRNLGRGVDAGRTRSTTDLMAEITGGRVIVNSNDPSDGINAAAGDLRGSYSIGFYAVAMPDNQWHALKVMIKRPGVTLRHRLGYLASAQASSANEQWTVERWNEIAYHPLESTALRIDARGTIAMDRVNIELHLAGDDVHFDEVESALVARIDVGIVERTEKGPTNLRVNSTEIRVKPAQNGRAPTAVRLTSVSPVDSDTTSIRVIVRDRITSRYGTIDLPVTKVERSRDP